MEIVTVTRRIIIQAPVAEVWHAITDADVIKRYLFGVNVESEWKKGSPITFRGLWKGKEYSDKGTVLDFIRNKLLALTHWSSLSGKPDTPDNYYQLSYELDPERHDRTVLTVRQKGNMSQDIASFSAKSWDLVLSKLKAVVEKELVQTHRVVKLFA